MTEYADKQQKKQHHNKGKQWGMPYKPGESGNPEGRPKDPGITATQKGMLDEVCPYDTKGRTWRAWLAEKGLIQASERDSALEHLKERLEGKVTLPIGGDKDSPIYLINVSKEGKDNIKRVMDGDRT